MLDETGRVIPARDFMPAVENTEIGRELDCNALQIGLRTLSRNPTIRLSINMSARSIGFKKWTQILHRFLKKDPTLGERLILEINETSVMTVPELVIDFATLTGAARVALGPDLPPEARHAARLLLGEVAIKPTAHLYGTGPVAPAEMRSWWMRAHM